ncbi:U-box domain-containing protein 5 [Andrographis paniculata]|uniref:U-box domain-containing protein 5 n=1 Tax=Andrographis paniculata TaxID=175694 RepID=UPI0021E83389|nr:U-box domain-containing protein 5 [Andrographis paniculata]XP_051126718.1 U-box domain-containing protein 5 [Andrographis paniculata]
MRNDGVAGRVVVEGLPPQRSIKVHIRMCSDLRNLVELVSEIIPEIEAARPRASGMDALCLLNTGIAKAMSLLQHCGESSVLYLVLTGDTVRDRFKKSSNLMEHCLSQIQYAVPMSLAAKISRIILAVKSSAFRLDPPEQEAAKILRKLLQTNIGSTEDSPLSEIHTVCSWLRLSSKESLAIEKGSIARLIKEFDKNNRQTRKKIMVFFWKLLDKYMSVTDKTTFERSPSLPGEGKLREKYTRDEPPTNVSCRPVPPKEFLCPLSAALMCDPVIIASGQTYERAWIQKWFDEGHDTCPATNVKLDRVSFVSNVVMKEVVSKWCTENHLDSADAGARDMLVASWEMSVSSIGSLKACVDNLNLQ